MERIEISHANFVAALPNRLPLTCVVEMGLIN